MTKPIDKLSWIHIKDRKVLYARSKNKDLFYNPGGKREGEETDEQALIREISEELDVRLIPSTLQHLNTFSAQAHGKPKGVLVQIKCFKGDCIGQVKPNSEIEELDWFTSKDKHRTSITGQLILEWLHTEGLID